MTSEDSVSLASPAVVSALLRRLNLRPSSAMGQNFLADGNVRDLLVNLADPRPGESLLEIGPGLGVLTEGLLQRGALVEAIEKDRRLVDFLRSRFAGTSHLTVIHGDALDENTSRRAAGRRLISNLPYSIGSRLLAELALAESPPPMMLVTVQEDVARRIIAAPGDRLRGTLTVLLEATYRAELVRRISPACFVPRPAIWSAAVRFQRLPESPLDPGRRRFLAELLKRCFSRRRQQMQRIARDCLGPPPGGTVRGAGDLLEICGIDESQRPETLTTDQWQRLAERLCPDC